MVQLLSLVCLIFAGGCGEGPSPPAPASPVPQTVKTLNAGEAVTVLSRDGDFAQVKTADGKTGMVPATRLQAPSGSTDAAGANQVLTASTDLLSEKPATSEPAAPRPLDDIMQERNQLNALYISADGKLTRLRPLGSGAFLDKESGQPFWLAFTCHNPTCSQQDANGRPPVFPLAPSSFSTTPDGILVAVGVSPQMKCPICGGMDMVRPYVLPETERRMKELADEHRRFNKQRSRANRPVAP